MRRPLLMLAAVLVLGGLTSEAWAQACPSQAGGQNQNLRRGNAVRTNRASAPMRGFSSAIVESMFRPGMAGGGGARANHRQAPPKKRVKKTNPFASTKRLQQLARRERVYDRVASQSLRLDAEELRAARYNSTADAAVKRGDMKVALAYYRLAAKTSDDFEAIRAKTQLDKFALKLQR